MERFKDYTIAVLCILNIILSLTIFRYGKMLDSAMQTMEISIGTVRNSQKLIKTYRQEIERLNIDKDLMEISK